MNPYTQFWQAKNMTEAWLKIVTHTQENVAESKFTSELLLENIPYGENAIEVGCGVGRLMRHVSSHFKHVLGVDISLDMTALAQGYLQDYPNCIPHISSGYSIPAGDACADFVYSYITFQHMPNLACVRSNVEEIYRVLRPGGICRVQTLKGAPFKGEVGTGGFHGYYFEDEADFLSEFSRCGFSAQVRTTPITESISAIWLTGQKPLENA